MYETAIFLGSGYNQIQYLKEAKKYKIKIICIDKNPNNRGFKYADEKIICSTHNHSKVLKILKKKIFKKYQVSSVMAPTTGYPYKTAQLIRKKYNLNYVKQNEVSVLLDKKKLRLRLNKINCSKIRLLKIKNINEKNFIPLVIKPRFKGTGGKGVVIVKNFTNLNKIKNLKKDLFVCEEFIKGRELAVDFIWDKKNIKFLNIGWHLYNSNSKKIVGATSQQIRKKIFLKLKKILYKICDNFNFYREVICVDAIVDKKENIHIIEFEFVPHEGLFLSKECFNYDLVKNYVNCYLNRKIEIQPKRIKEAFASIIKKRNYLVKNLKFIKFFKYNKNLILSKNNKQNFIFEGVSIKNGLKIEKVINEYYRELKLEI